MQAESKLIWSCNLSH